MARKIKQRNRERLLRLASERHRRQLYRTQNHVVFVKMFREDRPILRKKPKSYTPIIFEGEFSILKNRDKVILYIKEIDRRLRLGIDIDMDVSKSTNADLPTICMLSSYMLDANTPATHLQVTIPPRDGPHRTIWDESQFDRMVVKQRRVDFNSGRFLSRSDNYVNGHIIGHILEKSLEQFGSQNKMRLRNLNSVIAEIVENTSLHAHPRKTKKIPWIINTHEIDGDEYKDLEFCIIDLGVGIYDSIKENVEKWNTKRAKVVHRLTDALYSSSTQSRFLAKNIPRGIGSSTNEVTRGKGIRALYNLAQEDIYADFVIITNKAHVDLKNISNVSSDSKTSLSGTVYYWKIRIYEKEQE